MHGTSVENIMFWNGMTSNIIHPGQQLVVASGAGTVQDKPSTWTSQANPVQTVSRSSDRVTELIDYSKTFIGVPYVSAGMSPSGFDCSGFTKYVFAHFNINLPRTAAEQYNVSQAVTTNETKPGDLVAFKTGSYISHVGIYLGGGKFISATSSRGVAIASVSDPYWKEHFFGYARVIPS
ncbi:Murein DD-endopeptidase MepS/Murein LD-carboxypeptidase precursor [Sporotomaculum syntrophicum]|uniref:Murein DD-endopeptidase MepS/Murein LD-carboxypeptidase n=2 Tax=Sporotomaculum syntrophicum TaxID=182264 RepID=A0A9D2WRW4_9FIRM|nr:Murein DD-endopeptidase MepS/Murein LD-carboxypeptidase precursor [Sporotomaculum syntrophicum]